MCPDPSSPRKCTRAVGHSGDCTFPAEPGPAQRRISVGSVLAWVGFLRAGAKRRDWSYVDAVIEGADHECLEQLSLPVDGAERAEARIAELEACIREYVDSAVTVDQLQARIEELELELGRLQRQICEGPGIFGDDTTDEDGGRPCPDCLMPLAMGCSCASR